VDFLFARLIRAFLGVSGPGQIFVKVRSTQNWDQPEAPHRFRAQQDQPNSRYELAAFHFLANCVFRGSEKKQNSPQASKSLRAARWTVWD